jgi:hypothetical protein
MADDPFRERFLSSLGVVARNPMAQGMASAFGGAMMPSLGGLAGQAMGAAGARPELGGTSHAAPFVPQEGGAVGAPVVQRSEPVQLQATMPQTPDVKLAPALASTSQVGPQGLGGGGGGGGLGALRADYLAKQRAGIGQLDQDQDLARQLGVDQAGRTMAVSDLQEQDAARKAEDARRQQEVDADAHERNQKYLARSQELADEIGAQKIDSKRLFRNAAGADKVMWTLGAMLGGARAGLQGGRNEFMDRFERLVDRDVQDQVEAINSKKAQLTSRNSVFQQMVQETGDVRLAAMQTRNLMYEAGKQKLLADAERLGIPELRTRAEQAAHEFEKRQADLWTGLSQQAYQTAQQQAAAAAAARKAAEKEAWERSIKLIELGQKRDELEVKKAEAGKGGRDAINAEVKDLAKDLSKDDLAAGRAAVENAEARLAAAPKDQGLPGVGPGADFRAALAPSIGEADGWRKLQAVTPVGLGLNALAGLNDQERVSRGDWEKIKLSYQSQITGSGASAEERVMLSKAFEGAKSPAEQRSAIAQAKAVFDQVENRRMAGASPEAQEVFKQRLAAQGRKK